MAAAILANDDGGVCTLRRNIGELFTKGIFGVLMLLYTCRRVRLKAVRKYLYRTMRKRREGEEESKKTKILKI